MLLQYLLVRLRTSRCNGLLVVAALLYTFSLHDVINKSSSSSKIILLATALELNNNQLAAISELRRLVPPPSKHELGYSAYSNEASDEDAIDSDAYYARFLSVNNWDPIKTQPSLRQSIDWRKRVKPWRLRPRHCGTLCRQYAWIALTSGPGSCSSESLSAIENDDEEVIEEQDTADNCSNNEKNQQRRRTNIKKKRQQQHLPLDPPYNCPPLQSWRTTKHGLPITYFRCWKWKPHLATADESEKHLAYHIHHLIRRMPRSRGRRSSATAVSRICVIFDMRGFESWMLPYIHKCINILRLQYPGRAGAMCFINCPGYFTAVWRVISPWLDDEIRSKVFFAPAKDVNDVEKAIKYLNKMKLKTDLL